MATSTKTKPVAATTAKNDTAKPERTTHKTNPSRVKPGQIMALIDWVEVTYINDTATVMHVKNLGTSGAKTFKVEGRDLIESGLSADLYEEEQMVTKTRAAELLVTSPNRALTVCFEKQDGTDRILRGRLVAPEPLLGRSHVEDLDIPPTEHRLRLVDHRTIKYLIVEGVKYNVK